MLKVKPTDFPPEYQERFRRLKEIDVRRGSSPTEWIHPGLSKDVADQAAEEIIDLFEVMTRIGSLEGPFE